MTTAKAAHFIAAASLLALGIWLDMGVYYFVGWSIATLLLIYENSLVTPANLSKLNSPFFRYNSVISVVLLVFTVLDIIF